MKPIKRGFTLVEFVLAIAMIGILGAVLGPGLGRAIRGYNIVQARRATLAQARAAIDRIVHEIRLIQGANAILNISSSSSFQFEYPNNNAITYSLSGGNLMRNSDILADNVPSLNFQYFRGSGATTTTPSQVRRVRIQFAINAPNSQGGLTLATHVYLRALHDRYENFAHQ